MRAAQRFQLVWILSLGYRLLLLVFLVTLAAGGRAESALRGWLNLPAPVSQRSGQNEEEEERSETKCKTAATDRRQHVRVPSSSPVIRRVLIPGAASSTIGHAIYVDLPDHGAELRNGLGAPLLC